MQQHSNTETDVYIGLGSNLNNPCRQIKTAFQALANLTQTRLLQQSSLYTSKPLGPQDQPDYINAVAKITTQLTPQTLLASLQSIEKQQGRVRHNIHWGARSLDLDILLYGHQTIHEKNLQIPHSQMLKRAFVLYPLCEIAGNLSVKKGKSLYFYRQNLSTDGLQKLD